MSRLLIENGADLTSRSVDGRTPMHTFYNEIICRILLCHAEAMDDAMVDNYGMSLVHFIAWSSKSGPRQLEPYATKGPSYLMAEDGERRSALHFAAQRGNHCIIDYLLRLPLAINMNSKDIKGRSILHYGVESKRVEVLDKIVARGGDIHAVDLSGRTILHHAVMKGNMRAAEKLMELGAGADLRAVDGNGKTPLDLAIAQGFTAIANYLSAFLRTSPGSSGRSTELSKEVHPDKLSDGTWNSSQQNGRGTYLDLKDDTSLGTITSTIVFAMALMLFYLTSNLLAT